MKKIKRIFRKLVIMLTRRIARAFGPSQRAELIFWMAVDILDYIPPDIAAYELMGLDSKLYQLQGQVAIKENGGIHPKHHLMHYHDFFVSRIKRGERVLDFGTGVGAVAFDVAEKAGAFVDGIDISAENIALAKLRYSHERIRYFHGDGLTFPLDETYNVVMLSNVLEHLEERPMALKAIRRNSGAKRFLIRVPMFERDWRVAYKKQLGVEWRLDEDHKIEFTLDEFMQELAQANLKITHYEMHWGEIWAEATVMDK